MNSNNRRGLRAFKGLRLVKNPMTTPRLNHYRRIPPIGMIVAGFGLGLIYSHTIAKVRDKATDTDHATTQQLEQMIASGNAPPLTWMIYGNRLFDGGDFRRAALAYADVIKNEPFNRPARVQYALALAKGNDAERLLAFLRDQLYAEPKLAAELTNRTEVQGFLGDDRFKTVQQEANAQAMD